MKILITGVHGFIGSYLIYFLKDNHLLYGLDIVSFEKVGLIKTYSWEELNRNILPDVDVIIHLAGKAHDIKNKTVTKDYFFVNTELTKKIYDYFLKSSASKFIFFSSVKAAVDKVKGDFLTEEVMPEPIGPYGESKIKAEEYIMAKIPPNKLVYILRPCMIHGPGNKGNLNLLYQIVKKGIPWPLGNFENKRSFVSIDNLSFIIENLLRKEISSGVYHIADDETLSTNDIISIISEGLNKQPSIWKVNKSFVNFFAEIGTIFHLPLNKERLRKLTENYVVSNSKIKKALEIKTFPVSAREGMLKTIQSFRQEKSN